MVKGLNMARKCPNCEKTNWIKNTSLSALITLEPKLIQKFKVNMNNFIPVRAYLCNECGYIELYRETDV